MGSLFATPGAARGLAAVASMVLLALGPESGAQDATARRDILGTEQKLYSLGKEELIIRDFFQDRRDGFFLDVGFVNYLVTDHSDTVEPFYRGEKTDISSIHPENAKADVKFEEIRVPTITLTKLLERNGVARIDFLSMDIESAEPLALAGFDIERFKPELVCIEAKPLNREKILAYFAAHHYQRIERYLEHDEVNYYFTPRATSDH